MRRLLTLSALVLLTVPTAHAQQAPPRAMPVDPTLVRDPATDYFQHGRNIYESAKLATGQTQLDLYARAIEVLGRYVETYPRHPNAEAAWWYLGQAYYNTGEIEAAKRCFHTILNRFDKGNYVAAAAYTLAADHFNRQQYGLAATLFDKLASAATRPADRLRGLYYAGKSYQLSKQDARAIKFFRSVLDEAPPNDPYALKSRTELGQILLASGKFEDALELLDGVINAPVDAEVRGQAAIQAGAAAIKLNLPDRADNYFKLVLRTPGMEKFRPEAQVAMMTNRFEQKQYEEVIQIFRASPTEAEGEVEARRQMLAARSYMMLNRNPDAMPLFRNVEQLSPEGSERAFHAAYYRLICGYRIDSQYILDQIDAFLSIYKKKFSKDPKIHTALLIKSESLYARNEMTEAANAYREVDSSLLSEKNLPGYLYKYGRCLEEIGDHDQAAKSLATFLEKYPNDPRATMARTSRARALAAIDSDAAAVAEFDKILQESKDPKLQMIAYLEGADALRSNNELEAMVARYRAFFKAGLKPDDKVTAKASYWLGWGLVKTNHGAEAVEPLETARKLDPEAYARHAGLLLALVHLANKDSEALIRELGTAIEKQYAGDLPEPLIRWAANQAYYNKDYQNSARFYDLITDAKNPELAPRDVWRFLGKSRLRAGDATGALRAIGIALESEEDQRWIADGLADEASAHVMLKQFDQATKCVEKGLALRPEGRVGAELFIAQGDIAMATGKPGEAVRAYLQPVVLMGDDDQVVRPLALSKLIAALEKDGQPDNAAKYREELTQKYPDWKP